MPREERTNRRDRESSQRSGPQGTAEPLNTIAAPDGWEEEQISFPPYWNPAAIGNSFRGIPQGLDNRDPDFPRFVLLATVPIKCEQGPRDDVEEVTVQPGELFTTSVYAALPLDRYIGWEVWVTVKDWIPDVGKGDGVWRFGLRMKPEDRAKYHAQQLEEAKANPLMTNGNQPTP